MNFKRAVRILVREDGFTFMDTITDRFIEKGLMLPENIKEIGLWSQIGGGRVFKDRNLAFSVRRYCIKSLVCQG